MKHIMSSPGALLQQEYEKIGMNTAVLAWEFWGGLHTRFSFFCYFFGFLSIVGGTLSWLLLIAQVIKVIEVVDVIVLLSVIVVEPGWSVAALVVVVVESGVTSTASKLGGGS